MLQIAMGYRKVVPATSQHRTRGFGYKYRLQVGLPYFKLSSCRKVTYMMGGLVINGAAIDCWLSVADAYLGRFTGARCQEAGGFEGLGNVSQHPETSWLFQVSGYPDIRWEAIISLC